MEVEHPVHCPRRAASVSRDSCDTLALILIAPTQKFLREEVKEAGSTRSDCRPSLPKTVCDRGGSHAESFGDSLQARTRLIEQASFIANLNGSARPDRSVDP